MKRIVFLYIDTNIRDEKEKTYHYDDTYMY